MKSRAANQKKQGLTLFEVLLVIAVLAAVLSMFLPVYEANRQRPIYLACQNNLRQIALSYQRWSDDHNGKFPMEISETDGGTKESVEKGNAVPSFQVLSNELKNPKFLICPADKTRMATTNFSSNFTAANISYFVGVDATTNNQWSFLSGDDNFILNGVLVKSGLLELSTNVSLDWWKIRLDYTDSRHRGYCNTVLTDGSMRHPDSADFSYYFSQSGLATNRLAIP